MRPERPPITRTACTYSRVRRLSVSPRTRRAGISHETSASNTISRTRVGLYTCAMKMNRNTTGIANPMSTIRIITESTAPPKNPDTAP